MARLPCVSAGGHVRACVLRLIPYPHRTGSDRPLHPPIAITNSVAIAPHLCSCKAASILSGQILLKITINNVDFGVALMYRQNYLELGGLSEHDNSC